MVEYGEIIVNYKQTYQWINVIKRLTLGVKAPARPDPSGPPGGSVDNIGGKPG